LKYGIKAETILANSHSFIQINQKQIINGTHLINIKDRICSFSIPFEDQHRLKFSRFYLKNIQKAYKSF
jgi:hypothetical protein